jgi:hypothetical protein
MLDAEIIRSEVLVELNTETRELIAIFVTIVKKVKKK